MFRTTRSFIRCLSALVAGLYALAMVIYFVLRFTVGDDFWWLSLLNSFACLLFLPLILLFPLAILLKQRAALFQLLPFVVLGSVWLGLQYLPKTHTAVSGRMLKIVTFNVWGDNPRLDEVQAWLRETNADVVMLQEIPERYAEGGLSVLEDVYPYQFVQDTDVRSWGNAVLSRLPFIQTENFDLEGDGTPSHQRIVINAGDQTMALYNIHLLMPICDRPHFYLPIDNPVLHVALHYDDGSRNQQLGRLLTTIETEKFPFVVAGDFNTSSQSVIYNTLADQMQDSFGEAGVGLGGSWPVAVNGELPEFLPALFRVDYIWHSDHFQAVEANIGPKLGSDHLPVTATLGI
jgi:endonuclease/exonuclease/phosphatase (EEP) superfamily protein YafD